MVCGFLYIFIQTNRKVYATKGYKICVESIYTILQHATPLKTLNRRGRRGRRRRRRRRRRRGETEGKVGLLLKVVVYLPLKRQIYGKIE